MSLSLSPCRRFPSPSRQFFVFPLLSKTLSLTADLRPFSPLGCLSRFPLRATSLKGHLSPGSTPPFFPASWASTVCWPAGSLKSEVGRPVRFLFERPASLGTVSKLSIEVREPVPFLVFDSSIVVDPSFHVGPLLFSPPLFFPQLPSPPPPPPCSPSLAAERMFPDQKFTS